MKISENFKVRFKEKFGNSKILIRRETVIKINTLYVPSGSVSTSYFFSG
jgi:hypothetical protein